MSVGHLLAFLGHAIQKPPFSVNRDDAKGSNEVNWDSHSVKRIRTSATAFDSVGNKSRFSEFAQTWNSSGGLSKRTLEFAVIPSFLPSGVPEYPPFIH